MLHHAPLVSAYSLETDTFSVDPHFHFCYLPQRRISMSSFTGQPKVWSLWIYDRHCTLIYHADWSSLHNRTAGGPTKSDVGAATSGSAANGATSKTTVARTSLLPLNEQAKLVYGLVFSLRNMTRKLSPHANTTTTTENNVESLHSFSTSTYTLAHLHTPTKYTFVMLTDPVPPPTRRAPSTTGATTAATFSGGGGIPATGGMTTTGVLTQIARGPWVDFVARNPACVSLERSDDDDDDDDDDENEVEEGVDDRKGGQEAATEDAQARREKRRKAKQDALIQQRLSGLGKSVDSEAFRAAVERVLAQNKLNAPRM